MFETEKHPYELLVRWDQDGNLAGAHVQWRHVTKENGKVVAEGISGAEPVDTGEGNGFPLADILSTVQADALVGLATARSKLAELEVKDAH